MKKQYTPEFEQWWSTTMGSRMAHSKYLAFNAWEAALEAKENKMKAIIRNMYNRMHIVVRSGR